MMFGKTRLRTKILILLTVIPLLTLALYLLLAIEVFKNDKIAYVFETSSGVAKGLAAQTNSTLHSILSSSKPVMQEFILEKDFSELSRKIFESDIDIDWMAAYVSSSETLFPEQKSIIEKISGTASVELSAFGNLNPIFTEVRLQNRLIRVPFKDDRVLMVERVLNPESKSEVFFLIMCRLPEILSTFKTPSGVESYLINDQGFVLFGPAGTEATYLATKYETDFLERAKEKKVSFGTDLLKSQSGKEFLGSFAQLNHANLFVVSFVDKQEALNAVVVLVRKSAIFFLMLLCVTTIVALIGSGSITKAITKLVEATKKVAEGEFDIKVEVKSRDEVGSLADSFNAMAAEVSRLMLETAEKARMEGELKTAQTVQETLFPEANHDFKDFRVSGHYEPASECGGDWWHYCKVENKVYLWIGDATGHGAPAALITSAAKSAATIIERLNVEPAHALRLMNRAIYDVSKGKIMMTFFLASYDSVTKKLLYSNASHEAPFLIKKTEGKLLKKNLIPLNEVNNPRLGQAIDTEYEQTEIQLDEGDRILFYTDGIPDINNQKNEAWGERNFLKSILKNSTDFPPILDTMQGMVKDFSEFRQGTSLIDDITFFMCECGFVPDKDNSLAQSDKLESEVKVAAESELSTHAVEFDPEKQKLEIQSIDLPQSHQVDSNLIVNELPDTIAVHDAADPVDRKENS
jgi:sigma-B regulation protein RsbU (phosphoserine phosphatase)